jgi:hypothetical protein
MKSATQRSVTTSGTPSINGPRSAGVFATPVFAAKKDSAAAGDRSKLSYV